MTIIALIMVISAFIKRNEAILIWGIIFICIMMTGYVRNKHVHKDMEKLGEILLSMDEREDYLIVSGIVNDISIKENSVYYYLENVCLMDGKEEKELGKAILVADKMIYDVNVGYYIRTKADIYSFREARNVGEFDEKNYYVSLGIRWRFQITDTDNVTIKKVNSLYRQYQRGLYNLKNKMKHVLDRICGKSCAGLYKGILLGDKEEISGEIKEVYKVAGISHILAISGLHISFMGYLIYRSLRKISGYGISGMITAFVIISYGMIVGGSSSVNRAIIMFLIHILGDVLGRSHDVLSSMSVALCLMLVDNPLCVYNSGIQLSFMAILGMVIVCPVVKDFFNIRNKICNTWIAGECISIITRPIVAAAYYEISVYASITNILVIPLMSVVVADGFLGVLMGFINTTLGKICIMPGCIILKLYHMVCGFMNKLPYAVMITGIPDIRKILTYYGILVSGIIIMKLLMRKHKEINDMDKKVYVKQWKGIFGLKVLSGLMIIIILFIILIHKEYSSLKIQMLDVGQGDCVCIRDNQNVILSDCGSSSSTDIGKYTILPFLKANGVERVDYLLVSHSDADHINGISTIMEYDYHGKPYVRNIVLPAISSSVIDEFYEQIEEKARQKGIHIVYAGEGSKINFENMSIQCISPDNQLSGDKNDLSIVYYLTGKTITMLFTGDLGQAGEKTLLENKMLRKVDVLKVGHHGSDNSSSSEFLQIVSPKVSLISCGINNRYGHPGENTLKRLKNIESDIYITTECGQIDIVETKNGFYVESFLH